MVLFGVIDLFHIYKSVKEEKVSHRFKFFCFFVNKRVFFCFVFWTKEKKALGGGGVVEYFCLRLSLSLCLLLCL